MTLTNIIKGSLLAIMGVLFLLDGIINLSAIIKGDLGIFLFWIYLAATVLGAILIIAAITVLVNSSKSIAI